MWDLVVDWALGWWNAFDIVERFLFLFCLTASVTEAYAIPFYFIDALLTFIMPSRVFIGDDEDDPPSDDARREHLVSANGRVA